MIHRHFGKEGRRSGRLGSDLNCLDGVGYTVEELLIVLDVFSTSSDNGYEVRVSLDVSVFDIAAIESEFDLSNTSLSDKAGIVESSVTTRVIDASTCGLLVSPSQSNFRSRSATIFLDIIKFPLYT